ncbi:MAG: DUF4382 domain-containing protein [Candidatus Micrarchaeota archaeon]|nr:DUF4382 domain-containing protein [Candidatus Micrarchaeota archaeon]MDE1824135.1 DUF4382 domain-containing protein [Candidatus Micrarchaeota archaeon]MDE1849908.1 DUF4382 domain-containing protein [Candidatus Micrarchaeota archaeon]
MTLTELSNFLSLSPSTVSQHIDELTMTGAIERVESEFAKKWKYYRINPNFNMQALPEGIVQRTGIFSAYKKPTFVGVLVLLAAIGTIYYLVGAAHLGIQSPSSGMALLSVSDAPPAAALVATLSAINITVDNISVHSASTGKWYVLANSSQRFNLLQLRNISQLLTQSNLPSGTYNIVVLDIQNATVSTANGTEQLVIPSSKLRLPYEFNVSGNSTSWVNLDFDLYKSLHLTGSGKVIMTPVIKATSQQNATLNVSSDTHIITVVGQGIKKHTAELDMQVNGTIEQNSNAIVNQEVDVSANGKVFSKGVNNTHVRVVIDSGSNLTVADLINVSSNETNASGRGAVSVASSLEPNVSIEINHTNNGTELSQKLHCDEEDGILACNATGFVHSIRHVNISISVGNSSIEIANGKVDIHKPGSTVNSTVNSGIEGSTSANSGSGNVSSESQSQGSGSIHLPMGNLSVGNTGSASAIVSGSGNSTDASQSGVASSSDHSGISTSSSGAIEGIIKGNT